MSSSDHRSSMLLWWSVALLAIAGLAFEASAVGHWNDDLNGQVDFYTEEHANSSASGKLLLSLMEDTTLVKDELFGRTYEIKATLCRILRKLEATKENRLQLEEEGKLVVGPLAQESVRRKVYDSIDLEIKYLEGYLNGLNRLRAHLIGGIVFDIADRRLIVECSNRMITTYQLLEGDSYPESMFSDQDLVNVYVPEYDWSIRRGSSQGVAEQRSVDTVDAGMKLDPDSEPPKKSNRPKEAKKNKKRWCCMGAGCLPVHDD